MCNSGHITRHDIVNVFALVCRQLFALLEPIISCNYKFKFSSSLSFRYMLCFMYINALALKSSHSHSPHYALHIYTSYSFRMYKPHQLVDIQDIESIAYLPVTHITFSDNFNSRVCVHTQSNTTPK